MPLFLTNLQQRATTLNAIRHNTTNQVNVDKKKSKTSIKPNHFSARLRI